MPLASTGVYTDKVKLTPSSIVPMTGWKPRRVISTWSLEVVKGDTVIFDAVVTHVAGTTVSAK